MLQELIAHKGGKYTSITHGGCDGNVTNVTNKAPSFNGSSKEVQVADDGDTGEEGLLGVVCTYEEGFKRPRLAGTEDTAWARNRVGEMQGENRKQYTLN